MGSKYVLATLLLLGATGGGILLASVSKRLRDVFFVPGQPRTRRIFTRDAQGRVDGFVDRREGEDIRWTRERS